MATKFARKPKGQGDKPKEIKKAQEDFIDGATEDPKKVVPIDKKAPKAEAGEGRRAALKTANVNMRWPPELKERLDRAVEKHNEENPMSPISMNQWVINTVHTRLTELGIE